MSGCAPGLNCNSCSQCGEKVSFSTRRAPGTCCPEPSCDYRKYDPETDKNRTCDGCGKACRTCVHGGGEPAVVKAPTCCPEPTCDHKISPIKCEKCGAICPCAAWERCREDRDYFAKAPGRRDL
jgi:hypothetical protein